MSRLLAELRDDVKLLVRDNTGVIQNRGYEDAIDKSVYFYSKVYPRRVVKVETGNGTDFEWALPSDYYPNFSVIGEVYYPADETGEREPPKLEVNREYKIVLTATDTWKLRLLGSTPASGDKVKYDYTTIHVVTATTSTLPSGAAEQQVIMASASIVCDELAAHYSQYTQPTIDADVLDFATKAADYRSMAERYRLASGLKNAMEPTEGIGKVVCSMRDFDAPPTWNPDGDFMTHTRRRR